MESFKLPRMAETRRLEWEDAFLTGFAARVTEHGRVGDRAAVVLDQSAFYPESGGQMADRGTLGGLAVVDVQIDEAGRVLHVVEGALPDVGAEVRGEIDRARRRVHQALHSGQHLLSRALADVASAETVSSRLGETECTIDVDRETVAEGKLAEAEALVTSIVEDDLPVRAWFPEQAELRALPLRRQPKVTDRVRVVDIGGFDVSPCGGTHCARTAQIGAIRITGVERYKGKVRVTFDAGRRARERWAAEAKVLAGLARDFTCGPADVPAAVEKLRRDLTATRAALGQAQARLAESLAAGLIEEARAAGRTEVVALIEGGERDFLRTVVGKIAAQPGMTALLATRTADGLAVACGRGAGSSIDCGAFLKRAAAAAGGRGGGRPEAADGRVPAEADWVAIANATLAEMRSA